MARTRTRWWTRGKAGDRGRPDDADPAHRPAPSAPPDRPDPGPPLVGAPPPGPAVRELAARIVGLLGEAARRGVAAGSLRETVARAAEASALDDPPAAAPLAEHLDRLDPDRLAGVRDGVAVFAERLAAAAAGPIAVVSDPVAGSTWMWWDAREQVVGEDAAPGRVVLVEVRGEEADPGTEQLTVLVRPVEDPRPDLRKALTSRAVGQALDRVRRAPADPVLRAAAVTALSGAPAAGDVDWTVAFAEPVPRPVGPGMPALGRTVAVVASTAVDVGACTVRRTAVLHTVSPTAAAAVLLVDNPDLVNALVDLAVAPGDAAAGAALSAALATARAPDPGVFPAAVAAGTVYRSPEVGTTVRIGAAAGHDPARYARKNQQLRGARPLPG